MSKVCASRYCDNPVPSKKTSGRGAGGGSERLYCSEPCRVSEKTQRQMERLRFPRQERVCAHPDCIEVFTPASPLYRFCDEHKRKKKPREHRLGDTIACRYRECDASFRMTSGQHAYCCTEHRVAEGIAVNKDKHDADEELRRHRSDAQSARRLRLLEQGFCSCGKQALAGYTQCASCKEKQREWWSREGYRYAGRNVWCGTGGFTVAGFTQAQVDAMVRNSNDEEGVTMDENRGSRPEDTAQDRTVTGLDSFARAS